MRPTEDQSRCYVGSEHNLRHLPHTNKFAQHLRVKDCFRYDFRHFHLVSKFT